MKNRMIQNYLSERMLKGLTQVSFELLNVLISYAYFSVFTLCKQCYINHFTQLHFCNSVSVECINIKTQFLNFSARITNHNFEI